MDCAQGSAAWHKARLGIPTGSQFSKILTPATRKPSTQAHGYMMTLLAEWLTGEPSGADASAFMDRGTQLEPLARKWYSFERDVDVREVGIVLRDDEMVGASPDGLVGDDGTIEIKNPSASTHVGYLLDPSGLNGYFAQVQGALWLTGRAWTDVISYNPAMPPVVVRVPRDEKFIEALDREVSAFVVRLKAARARLEKLGCTAAGKLLIPAHMVTEDPF